MQCRIVNVTKTFDKEGGQHALANLSLTVEDGELMVIVGPSGCGKSTTLRCIAGLENVESGELVCGKKQKMLKRHLAVLHQLSPDEYRGRFDLRSDYPLVAPSYAAQRSEVARQTGLGRKPAAAAPDPKTTASKGSPSQKRRTAGGNTKSKAAAPRKRRATSQPEGVTKADRGTATG